MLHHNSQKLGFLFDYYLKEVSFEPVIYLTLHDKVLLCRAKDDYNGYKKVVGPDKTEFYLLDPKTGQSQLVSGVFSPLQNLDRRFLQPTNRPFEFWAAVCNNLKNQTEVGYYNLKDFSFQPILTVPQLTFSSKSMWFDETKSLLYLVYEEQLLSLPLQNKP